LSLAEQLRFYRNRLGLSQDELGEAALVHSRTISNVERGISLSPNQATVKRLARALNLTPDETAAFVQAVPRRTHHRPDDSTPQARTPSPLPAHTRVPEWSDHLIGRESDLDEVVRLLSGRDRLVMLTGPPGVGKTRLAAEASRAPGLRSSVDAVAFISLISARTADEAIGVIAVTLDLPPRATDPLQGLSDIPGRGRLVLILDNLEQIQDADELLARILRRIPRLRLITTSRHSMAVAGGREVVVAPLPIVSGDPGVVTTQQARESPAVQLLVAVAQRHRSAFQLTPSNVADIVQLCQLLDGIPLALEIAAAQLRLHPPSMVLDRFRRDAGSLLGARGGHEGNHRTLATTVDWSVNLLHPTEQLALARLGMFVGGFTLDAALQVLTLGETCPIIDRDGAFAAFSTLIEHHLVTPAPGHAAPPCPDVPRYMLLEMIREHALARLATDPELPVTARRVHARWVNELAASCRAGLEGPDPGQWVRTLDREIANIRVALESCAAAATEGDQESAVCGLEIVGRLWGYWRMAGTWETAVAYLDRAIAAARAFPDETLGIPLGNALTVRAVLHMDAGESESAAQGFERALAICRATGDRHGEADVISDIGLLASYRGNLAESERLQLEALAIRQSLGNWQRIAVSWIALGDLALDRRDIAAGERAAHQAHAAAERAGDRATIGWALLGLAEVLGERGRFRAAARRLDLCRTIMLETRDAFALGYLAELEGWLALRTRRTGIALERYQACLRFWQSVRNRRGQVGAIEAIGLCLLAAGDTDRAAILLHDSAALRFHEGMGRWARRQDAITLAYRILEPSGESWTGPDYRFTSPVSLDELVDMALRSSIQRPAIRRQTSPRRPRSSPVHLRRRTGSGHGV
jgi:predicted ATPase/transcriptional regulator with XRE-family HTH domain